MFPISKYVAAKVRLTLVGIALFFLVVVGLLYVGGYELVNREELIDPLSVKDCRKVNIEDELWVICRSTEGIAQRVEDL